MARGAVIAVRIWPRRGAPPSVTGRPRCGTARGAATLVLLGCLWPGSPARAEEAHGGALRPGAVELGMTGAVTQVEGTTRGSAAVRCGSFLAARSGLAGLEGEIEYAHVSGLDALGLEANLSWQKPMSGGAAYPYVALAWGLRQEWLGSFRDVRYPLGGTVGLRTMLGTRAATRIEYRFRRVLGDPVADFNEQELRLGLSVFFRNREATPDGSGGAAP
jgi:hypothetical protein